jgi:serine/threonine protein phosphatase PrpC
MTNPNSWLPEAAAYTSTGRVRSRNEDAFGYRADHGIFVVCDGMGGAAGGEVASRMAVQAILDRMCTEAAAAAGPATLHDAIAAANQAVLARAEQDPGLYGMGTTLVALLLRPGLSNSGSAKSSSATSGSALIAHAGDSRCYLYRAGDLARRTHDHSLVDEQLRLGTMTREEAARSPFRSVITRAVGTQKSLAEEVLEIDTESGDVFMLCTDGLTREINEEEMAEVLAAEPDLGAAAQCLVEAANEAGGHDNITCLLVRVP